MLSNIQLPQNFQTMPGGDQAVFNALTKQNLENQMSQLKNQYYAPDIQSTINNRNALTQGQNITNKFLPQTLQSENALRNANINNINTMTPLQAQQQQLVNQWYAPNQQASIGEKQAQSNYYNAGGPGMGVDQKAVLGLQHQIAIENPNFTPSQVNEAASAYLSGNNQLSDGTKIAPASGVVNNFLDSMTKHTNTASGLKQQNADAILDKLLDQGDQLMPNVSQFAGLAGKANQSASQLASSLGTNDPKYMDYQIFTRQVVPQLANQMLLTEGARVNNTQKAMMLRVADPTYWDSNPQQALQTWNYLTNTMRNVIKPVVAQGPSGIRNTLKNDNSNNKNNNQFVEGQTYTDKNGNRAKYINGQWQELK